jgi:hypothetical protein
MKAIFSFLTILTFLLSGCTSVQLIEHNEASYGEINNKLQGKKAQITLTNGENIKAENIEIKDHSISYDNLDLQDDKQTVPVSEVNEITIKNRSKSAWTGFAIAAAIGALTGVALATVGAHVAEEDPDSGDQIFWGLVFGVGTGLVFGIPIGAAIGSNEKYIISMPADSSATHLNRSFSNKRSGN